MHIRIRPLNMTCWHMRLAGRGRGSNYCQGYRIFPSLCQNMVMVYIQQEAVSNNLMCTHRKCYECKKQMVQREHPVIPVW